MSEIPAEMLQKAARESDQAKATNGATEPAPLELPLIRSSPGDLPLSIQKAEAALISQAAGIYQRGGQLVRIMRLEARTKSREGVTRSAGSSMIVPVEHDYLTLALARCARFQRYDMRAKNWLDCDPAARITTAYLANAGGWGLPPLHGIITAPALRTDGTLLATPGYDVASGLYAEFDPQEFHPYIDVRPTREAALAALAALREVFRESAFVDGAESPYAAVALAAVLTACVRSALPIAPAFGISSNKASTGKTTIAKIAGQIATGVLPPVCPFTGEEAETRKALLAVLMAGDTTLLLDNVDKPVNSASLCMMLTSDTYKDRVLGLNKTVKVPTTVTVFLTGNSLVVVGDLTTRVLLCMLDPELEHPQERVFKRNVLAYVAQQRAQLLAAALAIPLAYLAAGAPATKEPPTRFPEWDRLVRCPLLWLGVADPMLTQADLREDDPVRGTLLTLLRAWQLAFKDTPTTVATAMAAAKEQADAARPGLLEALQGAAGEKNGTINSRRLGRYIKRYVRRIEDGLRFELRERDPVTKNNRFRVCGVTGVSGGLPYQREQSVSSDKYGDRAKTDTDNTSNTVKVCPACAGEGCDWCKS